MSNANKHASIWFGPSLLHFWSFAVLQSDMVSMGNRLDSKMTSVETRVDSLQEKMNSKMTSVETRVDSLQEKMDSKTNQAMILATAVSIVVLIISVLHTRSSVSGMSTRPARRRCSAAHDPDTIPCVHMPRLCRAGFCD